MNYFDFNREQLVAALVAVKPGLAKKDIVEQATKFVFQNSMVCTFNEEIAVTHPIEHDIECAVPSVELYEILGKMNDVTVKLGIENKLLRIRGAKLSVDLNVDTEIKLPKLDTSGPMIWNPVPEKFNDALTFALLSVGTDLSKPVLTCIHWNKDYIESCDNFRLTRYKVKTDNLLEDVLISGKIVNNLRNYVAVKFAISTAWAHFMTDTGCIFSCKIYSGTYVDLSKIFNRTFTQEITFTNTMVDLLTRVAAVAEKDIHGNSKAILDIKNSIANVKATSAIGTAEESTRIVCSVDITFEFRIETLLHILKHFKKALVDDDKHSLCFTTNEWDHIVSLC